jgi:hypothetical protein
MAILFHEHTLTRHQLPPPPDTPGVVPTGGSMPRGHQKGQHCKWREFLDRSGWGASDVIHALKVFIMAPPTALQLLCTVLYQSAHTGAVDGIVEYTIRHMVSATMASSLADFGGCAQVLVRISYLSDAVLGK